MMNEPRVLVTIGKDGQAVVSAEGFAGRTCKDATAGVEKMLGAANLPEWTLESLDDPKAEKLRSQSA